MRVGGEHLLDRAVADEVARRGPAVARHEHTVAVAQRERRWCRGGPRTVVAGGTRGHVSPTLEQSDETRTRIVTGRKQRNVHVRGGYRLLAALLDVALHEVLGVGLEHLVDLVEEIVELGLDLLARLGCRGASSTTSLRAVREPACGLALVRPSRFLRQVIRSGPGRTSGTGYTSYPGRCRQLLNRSSSSAAVLHSRTARHVGLGPRSGSIIGTRRSGSAPMSNTSESQLAATMSSGQRAGTRPGSRPACRSAVRRCRCSTASSSTRRCIGRAARNERLLGPQVVVLQVDGLRAGRRPNRGRCARGSR